MICGWFGRPVALISGTDILAPIQWQGFSYICGFFPCSYRPRTQFITDRTFLKALRRNVKLKRDLKGSFSPFSPSEIRVLRTAHILPDTSRELHDLSLLPKHRAVIPNLNALCRPVLSPADAKHNCNNTFSKQLLHGGKFIRSIVFFVR